MIKMLTAFTCCVLFTGCVIVSNNKVLTLPPSNKPVVVTATSQAKCYDLFFIMYCRLNMEMQSSNGQHVSDFK